MAIEPPLFQYFLFAYSSHTYTARAGSTAVVRALLNFDHLNNEHFYSPGTDSSQNIISFFLTQICSVKI